MLQLKSLKVTDYRAFAHGFLDFDQTTIIIGENGSGFSTLLEALALTLDPALDDQLPQFKEYHFRANPDIGAAEKSLAINLRLQLTIPQEGWESVEYVHFPRHTDILPGTVQLFDINFNSRLTMAGVQTGWECSNLKDGAKSNSLQLLSALRHIIPVIHLKPGALIGNLPPDNTVSLKFEQPTSRISQLKRKICSCAYDIIQGQSTDTVVTVENGFEAVKALSAEFNPANKDPQSNRGISLKLREMLQMVSAPKSENVADALERVDSFTGKLASLMLANALIYRSYGRIDEFSFPLLIIEDPEAHLHSRTLAAIGNLVNRIKWQKIITTKSGLLLSNAPLHSIRRIRIKEAQLLVNRIHVESYSNEDLRRISYHLRAHHNDATFARLWILVEGESEFWILPQLARIMNYDFFQEGIAVIAFAQTGLAPLIKYATDLGISWHLLTDGDEAGRRYEDLARAAAKENFDNNLITKLESKDIEHLFWDQGFHSVYAKSARVEKIPESDLKPTRTINRAIKIRSKPYLALSIVEAISAKGVNSIPRLLYNMLEYCVSVARKN